jgi:hypothetical protein
MISFDVKIVLKFLLVSSVTTRFPTTSDPPGDESDWTSHSDCTVNAQARRGTDGPYFCSRRRPRPRPQPPPQLRSHIQFIPGFEGQSQGLVRR